MKPRAILFDLDDTLIDHSGTYESCWQTAAERAASWLSSSVFGSYPSISACTPCSSSSHRLANSSSVAIPKRAKWSGARCSA